MNLKLPSSIASLEFFFQSSIIGFCVARSLEFRLVAALGLEEKASSSPVVRIDDSPMAGSCSRMLPS